MTEDLLPADIQVMVRGWLHGNVVLLAGDRPTLIDTGYHTGAEALFEAMGAHLGVAATGLHAVVLTHVHSDHAGGVAALRAGGARNVLAHADAACLTDPWDPRGLWLVGTGQVLPRFSVDRHLEADEVVVLGNYPWRVIHTPGHATGGISLHQAELGILVSGDALWEDGFGMLLPWFDGPDVADEAAVALDAIEAANPRVVIPGHGRPFTDISGALARARSRLYHLRTRPDRLRHAALRTLTAFFSLQDPTATHDALIEQLMRGAAHLTDRGEAPLSHAEATAIVDSIRRG